MSGMSKEEKLQKRAEKNIAKRMLENQRKRDKQKSPEYIAKEKANRELELKALHNLKVETEQAKKVRSKFINRSNSNQVGSSSLNKKWEQKRKQRYNERVWKGWRESDSVSSPVIVTKLSDLNNR
ncbi:hypothetical protein [Metabacillus litoralis]|uniref:hypothetical protein n=1 Tax=Metabacillus litoralis TaxID=152268 RepID=UPI00203CD4B7|nr:hypothetical protein [Metabacillus litoralis]MCM3165118.1 hypothetical protein [Metabacillus litoralis]